MMMNCVEKCRKCFRYGDVSLTPEIHHRHHHHHHLNHPCCHQRGLCHPRCHPPCHHFHHCLAVLAPSWLLVLCLVVACASVHLALRASCRTSPLCSCHSQCCSGSGRGPAWRPLRSGRR